MSDSNGTQIEYPPIKREKLAALGELRRPVKPSAAPAHVPVAAPIPQITPSTPSQEENYDYLRQAAARTQALFATLSDLAFVIKKGGIITEFHGPKDNDYFLSSETVTGRKVLELLPLSLGQQALHYLEKTLRTGQPQTFTCTIEALGKSREFQARLARSSSDEVIAVVRDVTERNRLEKEILEISNREQMRIGQDLHDGLGQHLTGITFLTRALENRLSAKSLPEATEVAEIGQLVLQALTQTRSLARGLFPVEVESHGLVPALKELATRIENMFGVSCRFEGNDQIRIKNQAVASHLFRLAQEAVNNSIKHGKARHVTVDLQETSDRTVLKISDDGAGFKTDTFKTKGLGLRIMTYRAQKIGGILEVNPGPKGGTVVSCSFVNSTEETTLANRLSLA